MSAWQKLFRGIIFVPSPPYKITTMLQFLSKMFGTKSQKDVESVQPIVDQILQVYPTLQSLSNEELREKTVSLKKTIQDFTAAESTQIADIKARIEADVDMDVDAKDNLYKEIDEFEKEIDTKTEEILNKILPEAFAVCKETASRFTKNDEIKVKATEIDYDYLKRHPNAKNVEIRDGYAYWKNRWTAAGGEVAWNMVH